MGWFSRKPKDDSIGTLCRLLVERPWEWAPGRSGGIQTLTHVSGVWVGWDVTYSVLQVLLSAGGDVSSPLSPDRAEQLYAGVLANLAARVERPRVTFDDATRAVARAVLDGDKEAAFQLADWVMEHCGGTKTEGDA